MDKGQAFAEEFLAHYSSQYYDPAKAHDYYLRTRQLTGRQPGQKLTKAQREGVVYARHQIHLAEKQSLAAAAKANKQQLSVVHASAQKRRAEISVQLKALQQALNDTHAKQALSVSAFQKAKAQKIVADTAAKIAALPPIPNGASKTQRAALLIKRSQAIASINAQAASQRQALSSSVSTARTAVNAASKTGKTADVSSASKARADVSAQLKTSVSNARTRYQALTKQLRAGYKQTTLKEITAISNQPI